MKLLQSSPRFSQDSISICIRTISMPTELREAGLRIPKLHSAGCSRAEPATANKMRFWEEQENAGYQLYMKIQRNIGSPLARSAFRSRSTPFANANEACMVHTLQVLHVQMQSERPPQAVFKVEQALALLLGQHPACCGNRWNISRNCPSPSKSFIIGFA